MTKTNVDKNIVELLGINALAPQEQSLFLEEVGSVILDGVMLRLASLLTDSEIDALSQYLETQPEPQILLGHIIEHYSGAEAILEDVVSEFKEDAQAVLEKNIS